MMSLVLNRDESTRKSESSSVLVALEESCLNKVEQDKCKDFLIKFDEVFSDKRRFTHQRLVMMSTAESVFMRQDVEKLVKEA